jgi:hypothetical protein
MFDLSDQVRAIMQRRTLFYIHFCHILMRTEFESQAHEMSVR